MSKASGTTTAEERGEGAEAPVEPSYAIGVDLGGTNLKVALVERTRGVVRRASSPSDAERGPHIVLDRIAEGIARVAAALPAGASLEGIGVGAPGAVSMDRTTVTKPPNFPGWDEVHFPTGLGRRLRALGLGKAGEEGALPILVENDANAAGLGSAFYGAGMAYEHFIMVTLGTGVGGAIIYDRRIFRGATGAAGELGHMSIDYEGPYARSGVAGAVEAYVGQHFLSRHARYQLLTRETELHETAGHELCDVTPQKLYTSAVAGDPEAAAVLAWAGHKLGVMLGSAVNLLDIRKVVVGGGVSAAGEFVLGPARETMRRFVMPAMREGVEMVQETRGNEVALLGAARLVFERLEEGRTAA